MLVGGRWWFEIWLGGADLARWGCFTLSGFGLFSARKQIAHNLKQHKQELFEEAYEEADPTTRRALDILQEKGTSSWLTAQPSERESRLWNQSRLISLRISSSLRLYRLFSYLF
jgi:hypothetical protein